MNFNYIMIDQLKDLILINEENVGFFVQELYKLKMALVLIIMEI